MSDDLKAELRAKAEKLGIDVNHRWGIPRLEDEIAKATQKDDHHPELQEPDPVEPEDEPALEPEKEPAMADTKEKEVAVDDPGVLKQRPGTVKCTVTKAGKGKIFTEKEDGSTYDHGATIYLEPDNARSLEKRAFVEANLPDEEEGETEEA